MFTVHRCGTGRWLVVLGLVCLVTAKVRSSEPVAFEDWMELRSPGLTIVTDAQLPLARSVLRSLQVLRSVVVELTLGEQMAATFPTTVFLFEDPSSFPPFEIEGRDGQFFRSSFEGLVVVKGADRERPLSLRASHEFLHALIAESRLEVPLWLSEGLAEYYSSFRIAAREAVLGEPVPRHRARLRNRAFMPFSELSAVGSRTADYLDQGRAERFYAQSWLTVHYLMSRGERAAGMFELLQALERGESLDTAVVAALDMPIEQLDNALRRYLNLPMLPTLVLRIPDNIPSHAVNATLSSPAVSYRLGMLAAEQARWSGSDERYEWAHHLLVGASRDSGVSADAIAGLAYLEESRGRNASAARGYRRAIHLDPLEARSYALFARFLMASEGSARGRPSPDLDEVRMLLERALELSPRHGGLRRWLGEINGTVGSGPARDRRR